MNYDFKNSKVRINDILSSKTEIEERARIPENEAEFTYDNGIRTWVGALLNI